MSAYGNTGYISGMYVYYDQVHRNRYVQIYKSNTFATINENAGRSRFDPLMNDVQAKNSVKHQSSSIYCVVPQLRMPVGQFFLARKCYPRRSTRRIQTYWVAPTLRGATPSVRHAGSKARKLSEAIERLFGSRRLRSCKA